MVSRESRLVGKDSRAPVSHVLILGGKGRLGAALARQWSTSSHEVLALARPEADVYNLTALEALLHDTAFEILVNATGLTNVDRCEVDRDEALTVNTLAPELMARIATAKGTRFIHVSTDYVFDGEKTSPYVEEDVARPLSYYGDTKLAGEEAVLAVTPEHVVARVSWVFGPEKPSFVDMIIDRALVNDRVEAVGDKISCPTFADDVADWLAPFFDLALPGGLYHACNTGACTWQEYGQEALNCAAELGLPLKTSVVESVPLASMKAFVAPRPPYTAMSTERLATAIGFSPRPWQEAVADFLAQKYAP